MIVRVIEPVFSELVAASHSYFIQRIEQENQSVCLIDDVQQSNYWHLVSYVSVQSVRVPTGKTLKYGNKILSKKPIFSCQLQL